LSWDFLYFRQIPAFERALGGLYNNMKTITLTHNYATDPDTLWQKVTDYTCLAKVMEGIIAFEGLPSGRTFTGQKCEVMVSLFGKLPAQPYTMEILECDDDARILRSSEKGAGVKSWHHRLTVQSTPEGARLTDQIEIDAGLLTPLFAIWARYLYRARHKPRLRMLGEE